MSQRSPSRATTLFLLVFTFIQTAKVLIHHC